MNDFDKNIYGDQSATDVKGKGNQMTIRNSIQSEEPGKYFVFSYVNIFIHIIDDWNISPKQKEVEPINLVENMDDIFQHQRAINESQNPIDSFVYLKSQDNFDISEDKKDALQMSPNRRINQISQMARTNDSGLVIRDNRS